MKLVKQIFCTVIIISLFSMNAFAEGNEISSWAFEEVIQARDERLIPEELQDNYSATILRYEYVLLANQMLERNGMHIKVVEEYPFADIDGHPYEDEIIKAYNAGIIKGYGDRTFRPDSPISRQEIASLVTNLSTVINPEQETYIVEEYEYDDENEIGGWATKYIDYCYNYNIIKGTGKGSSGLDVINPLGGTTREQAFIMMYRLGQKDGVLEKFNLGTINIEDESIGETVSSNIINDFAQNFGEAFALKIKVLSDDGATVELMESDVAEVLLTDGERINANFDDEYLEITLITFNDPEDELIDTLNYIFSVYGESQLIETTLNEEVDKLLSATEYTNEVIISEDIGLSFVKIKIGDNYQYVFKLDKSVF